MARRTTGVRGRPQTRPEDLGIRKRVFPASIAWLYPLSLLAQGGEKRLQLARKFCIGEAGTRTPCAHDDLGPLSPCHRRASGQCCAGAECVLAAGFTLRALFAVALESPLAAWLGTEKLGVSEKVLRWRCLADCASA